MQVKTTCWLLYNIPRWSLPLWLFLDDFFIALFHGDHHRLIWFNLLYLHNVLITTPLDVIILLWILLDQLLLWSSFCCLTLRLHFFLFVAAFAANQLVRLGGAPALQPTTLKLLLLGWIEDNLTWTDTGWLLIYWVDKQFAGWLLVLDS